MAELLIIPLESIRTDGWFERIGEGIGSFQALCEIVGSKFFAFAMITGARIVSLTVDRKNPDHTLVDFLVGADEEDIPPQAQQLTLADFRRRLVSALTTEEPIAPPPTRATDQEAAQLHIGVRYILLAPLYGYSLRELRVSRDDSEVQLLYEGGEQTYSVTAFRMRLRSHVREELERARRTQSRGAIDLGLIGDAEAAATRGDPMRVVELLGAWPAPLAIILRTPEGQMLAPETRALIAKALGLLGSACIALGEAQKGEEVLRLGVQYAAEGSMAAELYFLLGEAVLANGRPGEAIGTLRRAANLGLVEGRVWLLLATAFCARKRYLAAYVAAQEALSAGQPLAALQNLLAEVQQALGGGLATFREQVGVRAGSLKKLERAGPSSG